MRIADLEEQVRKVRKLATNLNRQNDQLQGEVKALEAELSVDEESDSATAVESDLDGRDDALCRRTPRIDRSIKTVVARRGGTLLSHDGGMEENLAALPGLVSRADAVFFPIDCVSHSAVGQLKKSCRDRHKPFFPIRTASVASFMAAIANNDAWRGRRLTDLKTS